MPGGTDVDANVRCTRPEKCRPPPAEGGRELCGRHSASRMSPCRLRAKPDRAGEDPVARYERGRSSRRGRGGLHLRQHRPLRSGAAAAHPPSMHHRGRQDPAPARPRRGLLRRTGDRDDCRGRSLCGRRRRTAGRRRLRPASGGDGPGAGCRGRRPARPRRHCEQRRRPLRPGMRRYREGVRRGRAFHPGHRPGRPQHRGAAGVQGGGRQMGRHHAGAGGLGCHPGTDRGAWGAWRRSSTSTRTMSG